MNNNIFELVAGAIGQLEGPFNQGASFSLVNNSDIACMKLGVSIGEKDLMKLDANGGFYFTIDNEQIHMKFSIDDSEVQPQFLLTKSCLYETERETEISTISFPNGAPASTIIEYSIQRIGD